MGKPLLLITDKIVTSRRSSCFCHYLNRPHCLESAHNCDNEIGHFRVAVSLIIEAWLSAKFFI